TGGALEGAADDDPFDGAGGEADDRADHRDEQDDHQHLLASVDVSQPAADRGGGRGDEQEGGGGPAGGGRIGLEFSHEAGQRDEDHRGFKGAHQLGGDQHGDDLCIAGPGGPGVLLV